MTGRFQKTGASLCAQLHCGRVSAVVCAFVALPVSCGEYEVGKRGLKAQHECHPPDC
jgi:hypothetical protein